MRILVTHPGQFGDILWSMPAVRDIATKHMVQVDFATTSSFESLIRFLESQVYIRRAFVVDEWKETGRPHGVQPWESPWFPGKEQYNMVIDLGYRSHPVGMTLTEWMLRSAGIYRVPTRDDLPFLEVPMWADSFGMLAQITPTVAYAFNDMFPLEKKHFLEALRPILNANGITLADVSGMDWIYAASTIKHSLGFFGCRSSNYVLAHGLGKRVIVYEPHPARKGPVFNCPFGRETEVINPSQVAQIIFEWRKEAENVASTSDTGRDSGSHGDSATEGCGITQQNRD